MDANRQSSTYSLLRQHGVDRRAFIKFCTAMAATMGLEATMVPRIVAAMETKPRIPVLWLHGLECTCCSESFIRSSHPITQDVVLNMISLDYDDTLQAAAGEQCEEIRQKIMKDYKGRYLLAVEGNAPTKDGGVYCTVGGRSFLDILKETAEDAHAIVAWGSCASNGCVQNAHPNPTGAEPIRKIISHKPIINVPGCPPIAEVMTGVLTYILTFDQLPELDRNGRPKMFYGQRIHDKCYRRAFFDACRVRRGLGRRRRAQGLVPLQNGLPRALHLQCLLLHEVEQRSELPHRQRPSLHRLLGRKFLGQRPVLSSPVLNSCTGHRLHSRCGRQDPGDPDRHRCGGPSGFLLGPPCQRKRTARQRQRERH